MIPTHVDHLGLLVYEAWKRDGRAGAQRVLAQVEPHRRARVRQVALAWWAYHLPKVAARRAKRMRRMRPWESVDEAGEG